MILLMKPFKVSEYIIEHSSGNEGTVDEIQLFYTKLKTPDDKIVILPNGTLANHSLTNATYTPQRRIDIAVGISYNSDIKRAKEVVLAVLTKEDRILQDMIKQVFVEQLGGSEVSLGIRCMVLNENYLDTKWALLENIKLAFDQEGIEIPYSQLDVHMR